MASEAMPKIVRKTDATVPITANETIRSIIDRKKPTIAKTLGLLNIPISEKTNPRSHISQPNAGTQ